MNIIIMFSYLYNINISECGDDLYNVDICECGRLTRPRLGTGDTDDRARERARERERLYHS